MQQRDGNLFTPGALGALMLGVDENGLYAPVTVPIVAPAAAAASLAVGQKSVPVAATAVALSAAPTTLRAGVTIRAHDTNDGVVYIGPAGVTALTGYALSAGQSVMVPITDLSLLHVYAAVATDGVSFIGH